MNEETIEESFEEEEEPNIRKGYVSNSDSDDNENNITTINKSLLPKSIQKGLKQIVGPLTLKQKQFFKHLELKA